jgi:RNA polymerase sporulation-specific sigma factor
MPVNKVEICGVNTSKLPVLTDKQQRELLAKIKKGDEKARDEFVWRRLYRIVLHFGILVPVLRIRTLLRLKSDIL